MRAVIYTVLPSSAQPRLAGCSGGLMVPRCLPSGEKTQIPPGPVPQTLPCESTFMPSGTPSSFSAVTSAKTRPFETEPSAATSYRIQARCGSELAT